MIKPAQGLTALKQSFSNIIETRRARKAEPTTPISIIAQRPASPIPDLYILYSGHENRELNVMTRRLAHATVEEVSLNDFLNDETIEETLNPKGFFSRTGLNEKILVGAFSLASKNEPPSGQTTLRKITLGPDPYNGKDYYLGADVVTGGLSERVLYTTLTRDEVNAAITKARLTIQPHQTAHHMATWI